MRINNPPYCKPGDVVCCPGCGKPVMKALRRIERGEKLLKSDFVPASKEKGAVLQGVEVSFCCRENLTNDAGFIEVERSAQSYSANSSKKDGLDTP